MYKYSTKDNSSVTNLSTGATGIHPGNWMWQIYQDWVAAGGITQPYKTQQELKDEAFLSALQSIDQEVKEKQSLPFAFNGHSYYPDTEFIQGVFSALSILPSDYQEVWKTADKASNGVDNVYATLDKTGIAGLAAAYLLFRKGIWAEGEEKKKLLKAQYLQEV